MAGASSPTLILIPWANGASSTYVTSPIPQGSQQPNPRASYTDGFPPQTVGATGTPPDIRDFNGGLKDATSNIVALTAGQYWGFQPEVATQNSGYASGAVLATADGSGYWLNTSSGNSNNPDTSAAGSGWVPLAQYGLTAITGLTNANVTLTAPQAAKPIITLAGTLTGNVQIIFPAWTSKWIVENNTTGSFSVTCKTSGGGGVIVPKGVPLEIFGDGTNINGAGYTSGTFTGSLSGPYTSPITGTFNYSIRQGLVTLSLENNLFGTSTSANVITIGGIPANCLPPSSEQSIVPCMNLYVSGSSAAGFGYAHVYNTDIIVALLGISGSDIVQTNFPSGTTVGIEGGFTISYPIV